MNFPGRVLLDTNILNFTLDWGQVIFDGGEIPANVRDRDVEDIVALHGIFMTGQRAAWQLSISPRTYHEIMATPDPARRAALQDWFGELWHYWRGFFEEGDLSHEHADSLARRLVPSGFLAALPQSSDRELVSHAVAYGCDAFCTRDWKTILKHRNKVRGVPLRFLSPVEWWKAVRPYASLWI